MSGQETGTARRAAVVAVLTLYVVLLFAIPSWLVLAPLGSAGAPSLVFGLFCAFSWLLAQLRRTTGGPGARRPIRFALACFLACVGVSYIVAMTRPIESDEMSQADVALLVMIAMSGVLLVAHDGLAHLRDLETLVRRFVLAGGLMAALGVAQYLTRQAIVDRISIPGLTAVGEAIVGYRNGLIRISGTATSPIEFGALLTILLPLALHNSLHPTSRGWIRRWFPTVAIFLALALSGSRTAYVGLAAVLVVLMGGWPRALRWRIGSAVLGGAAVMALAVPALFRSIRSMFVTADEDPSIASRTASYAIVEQFVSQRPFFGHGLGTFLPKYRILDNNYLGLLIGVGVVGTIAFVAVPATAVWLLLRYRRLWVDERSRNLALSLAAGIVAGALSLAFFDGFGFPMTMGTLFLSLGISGAFLTLRGRSPEPPAAGIASGRRASRAARDRVRQGRDGSRRELAPAPTAEVRAADPAP